MKIINMSITHCTQLLRVDAIGIKFSVLKL